MEIDKKNYLVAGDIDPKTKEKIRLKLRLIFNNYKKCLIGTAEVKEIPGLGYSYEQEGYKHLFLVYKSSNYSHVLYFKRAFEDLYRNEIENYEFEGAQDTDQQGIKKVKGEYVMYIIGKSKKKGY